MTDLTPEDIAHMRAAIAHPLENRPWRDWLEMALDTLAASLQEVTDLVQHWTAAKARADKAEQERDQHKRRAEVHIERELSAKARVAALESGINAVVESVDALNDGGWTDLIAGAFDKFSRDLCALTDPTKEN